MTAQTVERPLEILKVGVAYWNAWRKANPRLTPDLSHQNLSGLNLRNIDFADVNLSFSDISASDLWGGRLDGANIEGTKLVGANLQGASLRDCDFTNAQLQHSTLAGVIASWSTFAGAQLDDCNLERADLQYCNFERASLTHAKLRNADLSLCTFVGCDLKGSDCRDIIYKWCGTIPDISKAKGYILAYYDATVLCELSLPEGHNDNVHGHSLSNYVLDGLNFDLVDLSRWDLSGTKCRGSSFLSSNLHLSDLSRGDFSDARLDSSILSSARLGGAIFNGASLTKADLTDSSAKKSSFEGANLSHADLGRADLKDANLAGCNLQHADFTAASLEAADVSKSNLRNAKFEGVCLRSANLAGAAIQGATFSNCNLRDAKLANADLTRVTLRFCNIQGVDFQSAQGLSIESLDESRNARLALYDLRCLEALGFPPDNNRRALTRDFEGVDLSGNNFQEADLAGANLINATLVDARLETSCLDDANLSDCNANGANFRGATLKRTNFSGAYLQNSKLTNAIAEGAVFRNADLRSADLTGTIFHQTVFSNAVLRDSILEGCDLQAAIGLYADQFSGTNLNGAKLPADSGSFSALENVKEITISARKIITMMLVLCAYAVLQIAALKDADLLTNRGALAIPILSLNVPLKSFFLICPVILISVYVWSHFYIQPLWEELAKLPAIFPDSRKQYLRVYPWFLNAFVAVHFPLLKKDRPLLVHVQIIATTCVTWWLVPLTIFLFWLRYLPCHEVVGTMIQALILTVAITSAIFLQRLGGATLKGVPRPAFFWPTLSQICRKDVLAASWSKILRQQLLSNKMRSETAFRAFVVLFIGTFLTSISLAMIGNLCTYRRSIDSIRATPENWLHHLESAADIHGQEISLKLPSWTGDNAANSTQVVGAHLEGEDFIHINAHNSFLAAADLKDAKLAGANLRDADLRWADLTGADLRGADLRGANLRNAKLERARLNGTLLDSKALKDALGLTRNQLRFADLR